MQKTVLITGVAGFVGTNVSLHLVKNGYHVIGIDVGDVCGRLVASGLLKNKNFTLYAHDLAAKPVDASQIPDIDAILHLAALPHVDYSRFHPHQVVTNNVESLLAGMELAVAKGVHFIFSSSVEVYGGSEDKIYRESDLLRPLSPYAASKVAGEAFIHAYSETHGLKATIFRFTNLYGPWQAPDRLLPRIICQALLQQDSVVEKGTNRDFVFVDDACELLERAITSPREGQIFNLSSGHRTDNFEAVEHIMQQLSHRKIVIRPPRRNDGRGAFLIADSQKIEQSYGWKAHATLADGTAKACAWYGDMQSWWGQFERHITAGRDNDQFLTDTAYWR